ncbi:alanine racemase [Clostridium aciditolerans]|uniref:Alanine racemase n=1 Tax=Clostridium aciditolerans TaxID=339861 RepID=A0A934HTJ6_9CLOT|nr:alanine racemase [Clostridium aciditolerans]MBI6874266.1 alanine racemase [Clostridium aciditolerans]
MFNEFRPLWAEINLDNFEHNVREIKRLLKNEREYIAIVKADAYGHGVIELTNILLENGIRWLGVAILDEALELRNAGIDNPILILGYTPSNMAKILINNNISQTCFSYELAKAISDAAVEIGKTGKLHIAVDTGMGRIGFLPSEESADIVKQISMLPGIKLEGMFTHFSVADQKDKLYTYEQYAKFNHFVNMLERRNVRINFKHAANSAAIIDLPETYLDGVRPGAIQYGLYPGEEIMKSRIDLKPVMSVKANIIHVKEVEAGTSISYGRKFITERKSKIATLPVGCADGYSWRFFRKGKVIVKGKFAPIIGTICMDQCMIDVTNLGDVQIGDEVILMGSDGNLSITLEDIKAMLGTSLGEVICMFSRRVPRVYVRGEKIVKVKNYLAV